MRRKGFTDLSRFAARNRSRAGQSCLPDKEFRYLRTVHSLLLRETSSVASSVSRGTVISAVLSMSPWSSDCNIPQLDGFLESGSGVQSLRILELGLEFPADCPHFSLCHSPGGRVAEDTRMFQHTARFICVTTTAFIVTAAVYRGFDSELRQDES